MRLDIKGFLLKKGFVLLLFLVLIFILLAGSSGQKIIKVSTVKDLVKAIAPDTKIILTKENYDLGEAQYSGKFAYIDDTYHLRIENTYNFSIESEIGSEITSPTPYYSVLDFSHCYDVKLNNLVIGHTTEAMCEGAAIEFTDCSGIDMDDLRLYGSGTHGIICFRCDGFNIYDSRIYDCSEGIMILKNAKDFEFNNCEFYENSGEDFIHLAYTEDIGFYNCTITDNNENYDSNLVYLDDAEFPDIKDCKITHNRISSMINADIAEYYEYYYDNIFEYNGFDSIFYDSQFAYDGSEYEGNSGDTDEWNDHEIRTIEVASVEDLIAAIAPYTEIIITSDLLKIEDISYPFVSARGDEYASIDEYGTLLINNVEYLTIRAEKETLITTDAEESAVIELVDCIGVELKGITFGHKTEQHCWGPVVYLENSQNIYIGQCKMFGCGLIGIEANECETLTVEYSEIYDCKVEIAAFYHSQDILFNNCKFYNNRSFYGFEMQDSVRLILLNCDIYDNYGGSYLFYCPGEETKIVLKGCRIYNNNIVHKSDNNAVLEEIDCIYEDNKFD